MKRVACVVLLFATTTAAGSQESGVVARVAEDPAVRQALESVDPVAIRQHMELLAADAMEGRDAFDDGYRLAAEYVAAKFESFGLEPVADDGSFLQEITFRRTVPSSTRSSMTIRRNGETEALVFGETFITDGNLSQRETTVTAPVVFVGFGVTEPSVGYDDYAGIDANGKIVATLYGAPPTLGPQVQTYYLVSRARQQNAEAHGAVGIITISPPQVPWEAVVGQASVGTMTWMNSDGSPEGASDQLRAAAVVGNDGLQSLFAGSPVAFEDALQSIASGEPRSFDLPGEVTISAGSHHQEMSSHNVVGLVRGADEALRGETVVLTAHLDHVGTGQPIDGDGVYNGAYDNASGTAILLEAARALASLPSPPRRNVMFAAVTAEERGVLGSDYLASLPPAAAGEFIANVNMDMVLMLHRSADVIAFGAEHSSLATVVSEAAALAGLEVTPDPVPQMNVFFRSDQYSFAKHGVPAVMLSPGFKSRTTGIDGTALFNQWMESTYHRPDDDMNQQFDFSVAVDITRLNLLVALAVANADQRPTWNEGDFFAEKFGSGNNR